MPRIGHTLVLAKVMSSADAILSVSLVSAVSVPVAAKKSRPEGPFPLRHRARRNEQPLAHLVPARLGDPLGRVTALEDAASAR